MKNKRDFILIKRINTLKKITIICFISLFFSLTYIFLFRSNFYSKELYTINNTFYSMKTSPRGRIYDRNHKLLVDNILVPTISFLKPNKIMDQELVNLSYNLSRLLTIDYSKLTERNLKDFYIASNNVDYLITKEEWESLSNREINNDYIYNLKLERIDIELLNNYKDIDREAAYTFFLLNNGFAHEIKIIKKDNLSDKEIAIINDNLDSLPGIFIDYVYERTYLYGDTLKSIFGNVSSIPIEEKNSYLSKGYQLNDQVGVSYLEKQYEEYLKGIKGKYSISNNEIKIIKDNERGKDIVLTIDIDLQLKIEKILEEELIKTKNEPNTSLFNSVFVVIKNPQNGDILALSGKGIRKVNNKYEAYDLTTGVLTNSMTPGSVVKGASIMVGYKENAIKIGETMTDNCIKIYSFPKKCSWKKLGEVDDIKALSLSSNIYQFKTAFKVANFDYSYNKKINDVSEAFEKYRAFFKELGLGSKSGIDLPIDGIGNVGTSNSPDLYLNYVIGQYDTYTTMQLSEYISTIANYGERVYPHLLLEVRNNDNNDLGSIFLKYNPISKKINIDNKYIERVRKGFKEVMETGLGKNFMGSIPNVSGKTGTSESFFDSDGNGVIDTPTVSNAFVGYYPSDNPKMSIAITFPNLVVVNNNDNRSYANKRITRRITESFYEIYK